MKHYCQIQTNSFLRAQELVSPLLNMDMQALVDMIILKMYSYNCVGCPLLISMLVSMSNCYNKPPPNRSLYNKCLFFLMSQSSAGWSGGGFAP